MPNSTHLYFFVTCAHTWAKCGSVRPNNPQPGKEAEWIGSSIAPFTGLLHYGRQNVEHFYHFDPLVRCSIFIHRSEDTLLRWNRSNAIAHHRNFPQHWTLKLLLETRPSSKCIWRDECVFIGRSEFVHREALRSRTFFFSFTFSFELFCILHLMGTGVWMAVAGQEDNTSN